MTPANRSPFLQALGMVWEFGYLIAVPLVLFALGGRWLDVKLKTTPWVFLIGLGISIAASTFLLIRKFSVMLKDIERESPKP